jgi:signal transduction histidine kinase
MVATPLMMEDETPIGVVQLLNKQDGVFTDTDCAVLDTISAVATMAYSNYRLTEESVRASSLLGMGKVSHDIGNLAAALYAYLNFSEVAIQGARNDLARGKPDDAAVFVHELELMLVDLRSSVDRIVGYSRLISDLAAGRPLRPNMILAPLTETIHNSAAYLEADARANHVAVRYDLDNLAPPTMHDELYVFRIVQNLVGNAVRAVKETIPEHLIDLDDEDQVFGEVRVRYSFGNGMHTIEVTDTGPGMSHETIERILTGNARSEWFRTSGSGWGTKIVLELAATHGASVSIDSKIGEGATFRVEIPHRPA